MEVDLFLCCSYTKIYRLYAGLDLIEEDRMKSSVFVTTWCSKGGGMFKSSGRQQSILQGCFTLMPPKNNTSKSRSSLSKVPWAEEIVKELEQSNPFSNSGEDKTK